MVWLGWAAGMAWQESCERERETENCRRIMLKTRELWYKHSFSSFHVIKLWTNCWSLNIFFMFLCKYFHCSIFSINSYNFFGFFLFPSYFLLFNHFVHLNSFRRTWTLSFMIYELMISSFGWCLECCWGQRWLLTIWNLCLMYSMEFLLVAWKYSSNWNLWSWRVV